MGALLPQGNVTRLALTPCGETTRNQGPLGTPVATVDYLAVDL